jgi:hypothetical protein
MRIVITGIENHQPVVLEDVGAVSIAYETSAGGALTFQDGPLGRILHLSALGVAAIVEDLPVEHRGFALGYVRAVIGSAMDKTVALET